MKAAERPHKAFIRESGHYPLRALQPFLDADLEQINENDLQAAFGLDRDETRRAADVLVKALMLSERPPIRRGAPRRYSIARLVRRTLKERLAQPLTREAVASVSEMLLRRVVSHNLMARYARVHSLSFIGASVDGAAPVVEVAEYQVVVDVAPDDRAGLEVKSLLAGLLGSGITNLRLDLVFVRSQGRNAAQKSVV